jgi:hypothetical protein
MKYEDELDWQTLSNSPNTTMEIIQKYPDKPWNWNFISYNPNTTIEFIEKYQEKPLNWWNISRNPNITMEIIDKYPDKPWDWNFISYNPNTNIEFIEKYPDKPWKRFGIIKHTFAKEKELFYQKYYRIYMATFRLQEYFNRMYDNPKYLFCRARLDKLVSDL